MSHIDWTFVGGCAFGSLLANIARDLSHRRKRPRPSYLRPCVCGCGRLLLPKGRGWDGRHDS